MLDGSFEALRLNCDTRIDAFGLDQFKQRCFPFAIPLVKICTFADEQINNANMTSLSGTMESRVAFVVNGVTLASAARQTAIRSGSSGI